VFLKIDGRFAAIPVGVFYGGFFHRTFHLSLVPFSSM
jgi:hypothetical protein